MNRSPSESEASDAWYMNLALAEAKKAAAEGEVPVGAVVVCGEEVVGAGHNRREALQSPTAHAEILAIEQAAACLRGWRLSECGIYVTLEPCVMCVGTILQARLRRLVFGCWDPKAGGVESLYRLCDDSRLNHRLPVTGGMLREDCASLLGDFFSGLREAKRNLQKAERWPSPVEGA